MSCSTCGHPREAHELDGCRECDPRGKVCPLFTQRAADTYHDGGAVWLRARARVEGSRLDFELVEGSAPMPELDEGDIAALHAAVHALASLREGDDMNDAIFRADHERAQAAVAKLSSFRTAGGGGNT